MLQKFVYLTAAADVTPQFIGQRCCSDGTLVHAFRVGVGADKASGSLL